MNKDEFDKLNSTKMSEGKANFNFYLNRQGAQGSKGEKGDKGFSPRITVGKDTLSEYTLRIENENDTFETANLREHKEDRGGTYYRYDRSNGEGYIGDADKASEQQAGVIRLANNEDFTNLSSDVAVTPYSLANANPIKLGLIDNRDETDSGVVSYIQISPEITPVQNGVELKYGFANRWEMWSNGFREDHGADYILNQASIRSSDGTVKVTRTEKGLDLATAIKGYTLPVATATTLGGVKVDDVTVKIAEDGTLSVNMPKVPTKTSELTNDSGFITQVSWGDILNKPTVPTKTSELQNDNGYITKDVNDLTNYTPTSGLAQVAKTGDYNDLINKPDIGGSYTLPPATASTLGGIKVGQNLTVTADGTLSATGGDTTNLVTKEEFNNQKNITTDALTKKQDILTAGDNIVIKQVYPDSMENVYLEYGTDKVVPNPQAWVPYPAGTVKVLSLVVNTKRAFEIAYRVPFNKTGLTNFGYSTGSIYDDGTGRGSYYLSGDVFGIYGYSSNGAYGIGLFRNKDNKRSVVTKTYTIIPEYIDLVMRRADESTNVITWGYKTDQDAEFEWRNYTDTFSEFINADTITDAYLGQFNMVDSYENAIDLTRFSFQYLPAREPYLEISAVGSGASSANDKYGIRGDYATHYGILEAPNGILERGSGKELILKQGVLMKLAGNGSTRTTIANDTSHTLTATQDVTLFFAEGGNFLEATSVFYDENEPQDGESGYAAWWKPSLGKWQFKSNDTGNVWREAIATPIANIRASAELISGVDHIGYRILDDEIVALKPEVEQMVYNKQDKLTPENGILMKTKPAGSYEPVHATPFEAQGANVKQMFTNDLYNTTKTYVIFKATGNFLINPSSDTRTGAGLSFKDGVISEGNANNSYGVNSTNCLYEGAYIMLAWEDVANSKVPEVRMNHELNDNWEVILPANRAGGVEVKPNYYINANYYSSVARFEELYLVNNFVMIQNTISVNTDNQLIQVNKQGQLTVNMNEIGADLTGKANVDLSNISEAGKQVIKDNAGSGGISSALYPVQTPETGKQTEITKLEYDANNRKVKMTYNYTAYEYGMQSDGGTYTYNLPLDIDVMKAGIGIQTITKVTQAQYDSLATKDKYTLYIVVG